MRVATRRIRIRMPSTISPSLKPAKTEKSRWRSWIRSSWRELRKIKTRLLSCKRKQEDSSPENNSTTRRERVMTRTNPSKAQELHKETRMVVQEQLLPSQWPGYQIIRTPQRRLLRRNWVLSTTIVMVLLSPTMSLNLNWLKELAGGFIFSEFLLF